MEYQTIKGEKVPSLGLGTWRLAGEACARAVERALGLGYRHIDTAQMYDNEKEVGRSIQNSNVDREDIFLVTKVWTSDFFYENVIRATHDTESGCILPSMSEKRDPAGSESTRLEALYRKATDPVLRTHLLMAWRMSLGDSIREVAGTVGYSEKWVREIARRYESEGAEGLGDRRHANPGAKERALLDEEGQAELREVLQGGSPPPGGGIWSGPKVARWIEEKTGAEKKVHAQRGWEYLRKVSMSPQVPRPSNAKGADASEREAFKKVSR